MSIFQTREALDFQNVPLSALYLSAPAAPDVYSYGHSTFSSFHFFPAAKGTCRAPVHSPDMAWQINFFMVCYSYNHFWWNQQDCGFLQGLFSIRYHDHYNRIHCSLDNNFTVLGRKGLPLWFGMVNEKNYPIIMFSIHFYFIRLVVYFLLKKEFIYLHSFY